MRFEFYHSGLDSVPKLSVDGTVSNSIHFSHWEGNETPPELKADTSTEIALNLVGSPRREEFTQGIELVTNNHFDTDGVLSVWTVLNGERALELTDKLIPAAESGDFSEFTNENAIRASIAIQGTDQPIPTEDVGSPLAYYLTGERVDDDARAYDLVLPEVERLLTRTDDYEALWRPAWEKVEAGIKSFEIGASRVTEFVDARLSVVTLAPELFGPTGFDPTRHVPPFTAISRYTNGQLFLIATPRDKGWYYRIDYPYYSWAETVVRPQVVRRDLATLMVKLNELETARAGSWKVDTSELASAAKFVAGDGKLAISSLPPDVIANAIRTDSSAAKSQLAECMTS